MSSYVLYNLPSAYASPEVFDVLPRAIFRHEEDERLLSELKRRKAAGEDAALYLFDDGHEFDVSLRAHANVYIDIKTLPKETLMNLLSALSRAKTKGKQVLRFRSFGYKYGVPCDSGILLDCRHVSNPYWEPTLRNHNGLEPEIISWLEAHEDVGEASREMEAYLRGFLQKARKTRRDLETIDFGCTGGQHRSVYFASKLSKAFNDEYEVVLEHREERRW